MTAGEMVSTSIRHVDNITSFLSFFPFPDSDQKSACLIDIETPPPAVISPFFCTRGSADDKSEWALYF